MGTDSMGVPPWHLRCGTGVRAQLGIAKIARRDWARILPEGLTSLSEMLNGRSHRRRVLSRQRWLSICKGAAPIAVGRFRRKLYE
jgi:hypothetical protein